MALEPGTKLGSFEVVASVGAGAMGEVYRALDRSLGREVALKVLPTELASDPERLARFEREAKVLASLNHPNVATIHGTVEEGGRRALVMELVPGEDIAARIERGPIPVDEAIPIARQLAEGLEAAHEHGVVHRDLKPANVKITPQGQVKILDFGLAKAIERSTDTAASPTITSLGTVAGVILGTAAYMSPEQARGRETDRRADIWAFGVILLEMLTGRRVFDGETISDTLAAVLTRSPDWSLLPASTPPAIRRLLERCLDRDPRTRLRDIGEARIALSGPMTPETKAGARGGPSTLNVLTITIVAAVLSSLAGAVANRYISRKPAPASVPMAFDITSGPSMRVGSIAVSPDGRNLVFSARRDDGATELWIRPMDSLVARPLPGTRDAQYPFWSPTGREIAYFAASNLYRIALEETTPHRVAAAVGAVGGAWGPDDTILFGTANGPIHRVAARGGSPPTPATEKTPTEVAHAWPFFLPDGRRFVFLSDAATLETHTIRLASLDGGPNKVLLSKVRSAPFVDPRGKLLAVRDYQLVSFPFDLDDGTIKDEPMLVVEGIHPAGTLHHTPVSFSRNGVLAYQTTQSSGELVRLDLDGRLVAKLTEREDIEEPSVSPDGRSIAFALQPGSDERRLWTLDVARGVRTPMTHGGWFADDPFWSGDGRTLYYDSNVREGWTIYRVGVGGGRAEENLGKPPGADLALLDVSLDERRMLVAGFDEAGNWDLFVRDLSLPRDAPWVPWLKSPAMEDGGSFSPDGRWVAYVSGTSGRNEIYMAPLEGGPEKARWQVSASGGAEPRWSADGKRLFFRTLNYDLISVPVATSATGIDLGTAVTHFRMPVGIVAYERMTYSLTPDGKGIVTVRRENDAPVIHVRTSW